MTQSATGQEVKYTTYRVATHAVSTNGNQSTREESKEGVEKQPQTVSQTADIKATDTMNPNTTSIGPATPMGRLYRPPNMLNEGEKGGEEDEKGEWVSGIKTSSSHNDGGDEDVRHAYIIPTLTLPPPYHTLPTPDKR
ncbi:hypothetical protein PAXINDRAFT_21823 [Paxillus involutus ATCC 200175]|uniref:Uncharacterized protein n=1 Tax=Paxillus involutus ATCC 200175 TaxID=664439 RepID=A0A0C9T0B4_PAXIN|nr:hypothetical protein PAXINDRAFT_21823 [Paxillus involutus ATCC 200175]